MQRDRGRPSACVTEIREQSSIASIRKIDIIFKVNAGAAFRNRWSPDLPCLSGLLLMTLSWVGSCVLAPGREAVETVSDFVLFFVCLFVCLFLLPKSLQMVIAAMNLKDAYFLEGKL